MKAFLILILMYISVFNIYSQNSGSSQISTDSKIDYGEFMKETQLILNDNSIVNMVWWVPDEYWILTAESDPNIDMSMAERVIEVLSPYIVIFVVAGKMGAFGGVKYESLENINGNCSIMLSNNHLLHPIERDNLEPDVKNFMDIMKPIFANILGKMGENMQYVLFEGKYQNGEHYIDAKDEGYFIVNLFDREFKFNLPLASLQSKKTCSKCGKLWSGLYNYCPIDGVPLE